jgi:hypothetical protein
MPSGFKTRGQLQAWLNSPERAGVKIIGAATPPKPKPASLAPVLKLIQDLAAAHGWAGEDHLTHNPEGTDQGLHVMLVRETIIFAEVQAVKGERSLSQQHWLDALRATGLGEVYEWGPEDIEVIRERLSRTRIMPQELSHG